MKSKIYILLPDGVGIKNYLHTDVLGHPNFDTILMHNFSEKLLSNLELDSSIKSEQIKNYRESLIEKFLRELIHLSRLKHNSLLKSNESILLNYNPKKNSFKGQLFYSIVEAVSNFIKNYNIIEKCEKYYQKIIRQSSTYKYYLNYFKKTNGLKLFCTHQRSTIAAPIFAAAKDAGLETITAIYSWDNLPKARLALRADKYIVWSSYMKNELREFYPEIVKHQIKTLGTPQFQFHYQKDLIWSKEKLASFYDLDISKKWLCFSGDDKTTSPFDPDYLDSIANEIKQSGLYDDWQVLLRPVPSEGFEKYQKIINRYPNLIKKTGAAWNLSSKWSDAFPEKKDSILLASICNHANAVINIGSTMAFDFGMHNKPSIYINYEINSNSKWSVKEVYKFQHFRSIGDLNPVIWLNNINNLENILNNLDYFHGKTKGDMQKWSEAIIPEIIRIESSILLKNYLYQ